MKTILPLVLLFILGLTAYFTKAYEYLDPNYFMSIHQELTQYTQDHWWFSIGAYVLIYITVVTVSIPGATLLSVIGGFLFGNLLGTLLVVPAATIGATLLFLCLRIATNALSSLKLKYNIAQLRKDLEQDSFFYLLTLRLIPLFPFVAINIAAAAVQLPLKTFFWGTFFGIIPGSFVYVSLGNALRTLITQPHFTLSLALDLNILIALTGLGLLALLPVVYRHWKSSQT